MKFLNLSICRYRVVILLLLFGLGNTNLYAQSGTSIYDAMDIAISPCNYTHFTDYQNNTYSSNSYGQPSGEIWYTFTISEARYIDISLCGSDFDTYLTVIDPYYNVIASNDDDWSTCGGGITSSIYSYFPAGTYYIIAEGSGYATGNIYLSFGTYGSGTPSVGADANNAIDAGIYSASGTYSHTMSNADLCLNDDIGQPSLDIYYKFVLTDFAYVTLTHCGSSIDTYMHLIDASTNFILATGDDSYLSPCPGGIAYIRIPLAAGTYYVVSEGYGYSTGDIVTNINISYGGSFPGVVTASSDQNYIIAYTPREQFATASQVVAASNEPNRVQTTVAYFDGLGRPLQTVTLNGSGDGNKDLIQPYAYDQFGRETIKYLPYTTYSGNKGSYRSDALSSSGGYSNSGQKVFYNQINQDYKNMDSPFSVTVIEPSPLNRVIEQGFSGDVWQPTSTRTSSSGRTSVIGYSSNSSGEVQLWKVNSSGASATTTFESNQLHKTISKDENWVSGKAGTTAEFKDFHGRVVLKRIWASESDSLSTYYVYDDLGNLRYVLPPAVTVNTFAESDAVFLNYIYGYHYDGRKRITRKKIPGKGWDEMIYNVLDRLIFSQDAVQGQTIGSPYPYRSFVKYDAFGRVVMTGVEKDHTGSREAVQAYVNTLTTGVWESRDNSVNNYHGYDNISYPWNTLTMEPELVNYYDNYNIPGIPDNQSMFYSVKTKGLLTATKTKVLGTVNDFLWTVNYYDDEGRLLKIYQQHYKGGVVASNSYDDILNTYSFVGELKSSTRKHYVNGIENLYVYNEYVYDHLGRKVDTKQKTGDNSETTNPLILLSRNVYNEIGQLKGKGFHATNPTGSPIFAKVVNFTYNDRGWLSTQNAPSLFSQNLKYNETISGVTPNYNGNISRQEWGGSKYYNYNYDHLNRLLSGISDEGNNEVLTYDVMGNIETLTRLHFIHGLVDQLSYNYSGTGNKLAWVSDVSTDPNTEFQLPGVTNYVYDSNGNMTSRVNTNSSYGTNNISNITYNHLNLPLSMNADGAAITYAYDAFGNKLKKVVTGSTSLNNEYISGIHYEGGLLKFMSTEVGRVVRKSANDYSYEYTLTDHLGNGRMYFDIQGGVATKIQEMDYYAFGLDIKRMVSGTEDKYQYNGKEKQDQEKMLDYGARFYDPVIGRWNVMDPLAELDRKTGPYTYVFNNPLRFVDPTGMKGESTIVDDNKDGTYIVTAWKDDGKKDVVLNDGKKVGESLTTHSFVDENNNAVVGAVIDTKSTEGQKFIDNEIIRDDPSVFVYRDNAQLNQSYDFKSRGISKQAPEQEALIYRTRGSMTSDGKMASARDFGNMAAGIVAARAGVPQWYAKMKFNELQGGQEPLVSAKAQQIGLDRGGVLRQKDLLKKEFQKITNPWPIGPKY